MKPRNWYLWSSGCATSIAYCGNIVGCWWTERLKAAKTLNKYCIKKMVIQTEYEVSQYGFISKIQQMERLTSLCSCEYEIISTPVVEESDAISPSTPPTTWKILRKMKQQPYMVRLFFTMKIVPQSDVLMGSQAETWAAAIQRNNRTLDTAYMIRFCKSFSIIWSCFWSPISRRSFVLLKPYSVLTIFNVFVSQNIARTAAWLTMYLTASGPEQSTLHLIWLHPFTQRYRHSKSLT